MKKEYQVIVVGAGHAGVEAALATARMGLKTLIITINKTRIANAPCNPSIGGPAKGIVTREIDALGGEMGKCTDECTLQIKLLNESKGPGVQALRSQIDKLKYPKYMLNILENTQNIEILEDLVEFFIIESDICLGVKTKKGEEITSKATIMTTGTYLNSVCFNGSFKKNTGPDNDLTTNSISEQLRELGFELIRLKTGTPPRIDKNSINYELTHKEYGSIKPHKFSYWDSKYVPFKDQLNCWLTYTNEETHKIIKSELSHNPLYKEKKNDWS